MRAGLSCINKCTYVTSPPPHSIQTLLVTLNTQTFLLRIKISADIIVGVFADASVLHCEAQPQIHTRQTTL